jgi:hypothetical protein
MADKKAGSLLEQANEQGFLGTKVDPTPNEAYTVAGVTEGQATPENDAKLAAQARENAGTGDAARDTGKK